MLQERRFLPRASRYKSIYFVGIVVVVVTAAAAAATNAVAADENHVTKQTCCERTRMPCAFL